MLKRCLILTLIFCLPLIGRTFDILCVEGRLSEEQVKAVNELEWEKCPVYNEDNCIAKMNDRVINRECSELSRKIFYWY